VTAVSEWLTSDYRPGRAGHPEEWRTEVIRQVAYLGLSQKQVAKNMGISRNTLAKWLKEDSDQMWQGLRDAGLIQKRPDAAEREAVRLECLSTDNDVPEAAA
jgi:transposase